MAWYSDRQPAPPPKKFTPEQVMQIRAVYGSGVYSYRQLANQWNCSLRCMNQVIKGEGAYKL